MCQTTVERLFDRVWPSHIRKVASLFAQALRQKAANDPDALAAPFDLSIVGGYPGAHLFAYVPAGVIPDKYPYFLAHRGEPLGAPLKEAGGYAANRTAIHKTQPHLFKLRHKSP